MLGGATAKPDFDKDFEAHMKQFEIKCCCGNGMIPRYVDMHEKPCPVF